MLSSSDYQLILSYLGGDEKSLEVLIKRYLKLIYSFVFRYLGNGEEAEDITQEIFLKVWRNLKKVDKNKSFKAWIFKIAKNTCLDSLKKKKALPFSRFENEEKENVLAETIADLSPLPDELFERTNIAEILNNAVMQLAPKYRMVLFLRYNDHFTFKEISEALEEPLYTVKSRHRRALIKLRKMLVE